MYKRPLEIFFGILASGILIGLILYAVRVFFSQKNSLPIAPPELPVVSLIATDSYATESGMDGGAFIIGRTGEAKIPLTVTITITGTATNGLDYEKLTPEIIIPAGVNELQIPILPINDNESENFESVVLKLVASEAYQIGLPPEGLVTIYDDDSNVPPPPPPPSSSNTTPPPSSGNNLPMVSIFASDPLASEEGPESGTVVISRTGSTILPLTVYLTVSGSAINAVDYESLPLVKTFSTGISTIAIPITPINDAMIEATEIVNIKLNPDSSYNISGNGVGTVSILDNDNSETAPPPPPPPDDPTLPTININSSDATASEGGFDTGALAISRTGQTNESLVVTFSISGTATNGIDYQVISSFVAIPIGQSTANITLTPIDDALVEGTETMIVTLGGSTNYNIGTQNNASISILDNDSNTPLLPTVSLSVDDPNAFELGPDLGTFRISRTGDTTNALSINFTISGTATNGIDYQTIFASEIIPSGSTFVLININPINDTIAEPDETVTITLSQSLAYELGQDSGTVTILDDDSGSGTLPTLSVSVPDPSASETGPDNGNFVITRTGPTDAPLNVFFTISGTATNGTDYDSITTERTISPGLSSISVFVTPIDDTSNEGTESVVLTLATNTEYDIGTPNTGTVNIADNDSGGGGNFLSITATDASASETGPDVGTITISRTGPTTNALNVNISFTGTATNGTDYGILSSPFIIPAGQSSAPITITPIDDTIIEPTESARISLLAGTGYTVGGINDATVNIADNDALPTVSVAIPDPSASEAGDSGNITLTRTGDVAGTSLTIFLSVTGTATNGMDYQMIQTQRTFAPGIPTISVPVTPINDFEVEGDETVIVTVVTNSSYTVGTQNSGTVTITDDDMAPTLPTITVTATDSEAAEPGTNTGTFTITRSIVTSSPLVVRFAMSGTATNGTDYTSISSTRTILADQSSVTVTVSPRDDVEVESVETAILTLASDLNYIVGTPNSATVNIADDDIPATVTITATDAFAAEPGINTGLFVITRSGPTTNALTVNFTVTGDATNGIDYTTLPNSRTIQAGQSSASLTVVPIDDETQEVNERVVITLSNGTGYIAGSPDTAIVTIVDND